MFSFSSEVLKKVKYQKTLIAGISESRMATYKAFSQPTCCHKLNYIDITVTLNGQKVNVDFFVLFFNDSFSFFFLGFQRRTSSIKTSVLS